MDASPAHDLNIANPKFTAVGATRVSTPTQMKQYGPDRQVQDITAEAQRLGLSLATVIHEQISGATAINDRETVARYFELAERHPGLHFIFPKVDRIGRKVLPILTIIEGLEKRRAVVHVCGVQAEPYSNQWWFLINQLSAMAQYDHGNIRENMLRGKLQKAQAGGWAHGQPPYGYELVRDPQSGKVSSVRVVEEQAHAIRRIFELAHMYGAARIKDILEEEGVPPPPLPRSQEGRSPRSGREWATSSIKNILKNPAYSGRYVMGRHSGKPASEWVTVPIPVIIPLDQWEKTQQTLKTRVKERPSYGQKGQLLCGFVRCAVCEGAIGWTSTRAQREARYHYYRCWLSNVASARRQNREPCSHKRYWKVAELDQLAWTFLVEKVSDVAYLDDLLNGPRDTTMALDHSGRITELEAAIKRCFEPYAKGDLPYKACQEMAEPYQQELATLKALARPEVRELNRIDAQVVSSQLAAGLQMVDSMEDRREFLTEFGVQFWVGPEGVVGFKVRTS